MMRFPTAVLFLRLLVLVGATFTDPTQWPGFSNLPLCVQSVFPGGCPYGCTGGCIPCDVGCGTWMCACNGDFFAAAISAASSVASTGCSASQADAIASATSIVNGFCRQLLLATLPPSGPSTPTPPPTTSSTTPTRQQPTPPSTSPPATSSTSSTSDTSTSSTAASSTITSSTTATSTTATSTTASSTGAPPSGTGFSLSERISLGVGIGVGVGLGLPGAIVAIWEICRRLELGCKPISSAIQVDLSGLRRSLIPEHRSLPELPAVPGSPSE